VWTVTGALATAHAVHSATLLDNGEVLVAGGINFQTSQGIATAELYDPVSGGWTVTGRLNVARGSHTASLLPDGQVLVVAGNPGELASAELYNISSEKWTLTDSLIEGRERPTATTLLDGKVLVTGGYYAAGSGTRKSSELYDSGSEE
jgi:hypothetical protein